MTKINFAIRLGDITPLENGNASLAYEYLGAVKNELPAGVCQFSDLMSWLLDENGDLSGIAMVKSEEILFCSVEDAALCLMRFT